jgi:hypothetical protein
MISSFFRRSTCLEHTPEIYSSNSRAKFVAYYGYDEENVETVEVRSCGLCHGESVRRDNFKGATIRLLGAGDSQAVVTADGAMIRTLRVPIIAL